MKKGLLAFVLVFSIVTVANAAIIDVVTDGVGDAGHAGTINDPLEIGETLEIKIIVGHNPYPGYPSYDGYMIKSMDMNLDLEVSGAGSLTATAHCKCGYISLDWHDDFSSYSPLQCHEPGCFHLSDLYDNHEHFTGILDSNDGVSYPEELIRHLAVHGEGNGRINVDMTMTGLVVYSPYTTMGGAPYPGDWLITFFEDDFSNLVVYSGEQPIGDLSGDWDVDLDDFARFASQWRRTGCGQCDGADLTGEGNVDFMDLNEFGENWLSGCL